MATLLAFLIFIFFILFIVGIFSPKTSLFWYKGIRSRKKSLLIYGGLTILFFIIFGATSDSRKGQINSSSSESLTDQLRQSENTHVTERKKQPENPDKVDYSKIGDVITVGDFRYKVNQVLFRKSIGVDEFNKGEVADGIFLIINLSITNLGDEAHILDDSFFKLTDDNGVEYSTADANVMIAMQMEGKETLFLKQFNPHIQKSGYLVFEVPSKNVYDLHLSGGFWSGKTYAVKLTL